ILALAMTKRMRVVGPFCADHVNHWRNRVLIITLTFLGFLLFLAADIGTAAALSSSDPNGSYWAPALILLGVVFLTWLIGAVILQSTSVPSTEITDRDIALAGVSDAFVDAVREDRDREREEEDEDEYDRPWRRRRGRDYDRDDSRYRRRPRTRDFEDD